MSDSFFDEDSDGLVKIPKFNKVWIGGLVFKALAKQNWQKNIQKLSEKPLIN